MGSRTMPTECDTCGGIIDWGDFGPEDGTSEPTCTCPPLPTLIPPRFYGTNSVMNLGDELWHFELGRGRVIGWRFGMEGSQIRAGLIAKWEHVEGEHLTWTPSIRHREMKPGPPPPTTVTVDLPAHLADRVRSGAKIVPKDTDAVDLWRHVERALRRGDQ